MKRAVIGCLAVILIGIAGITIITDLLQTDPTTVAEPPWNSPQTRELAVRACFDCHSNQTQWPWFTRLPIGSQLALSDTIRGRNSLNFSEWGVGRAGSVREISELSRVIQEGSMPPWYYTILHPNAVLSDTEKQLLTSGLQASLQ